MFIQRVYLVSSTKGLDVISHNILTLELIEVHYIILTQSILKHVDVKHGEF